MLLLEIFDRSIPGVEEQLGKKTEICYVTEYSDDKNVVGLNFKTLLFSLLTSPSLDPSSSISSLLDSSSSASSPECQSLV